MKRIAFLFLTFFLLSSLAFAQDEDDTVFGDGTTVSGPVSVPSFQSVQDDINAANGGNIGYYIVDWVTQGASFSTPRNSLLGAVSLSFNTFVLMLTIWVMGYNAAMYALHTAKFGVPGGHKIAGGLSTLRNALAVSFLVPILGNGFSPSQAIINSMANISVWGADSLAVAGSQFIEQEGAIVSPPVVGIHDVIWTIVQAEACHSLIKAYHQRDVDLNARMTDVDPTSFSVSQDGNLIKYEWGFSNWTKGTMVQVPGSPLYYNGLPVVTTTEPRIAFGETYKSEDGCGSLQLELPKEIADVATLEGTGSVHIEGEHYLKPIVYAQHNGLLSIRRDIKPIMQSLMYDEIYMHFRVSMKEAISYSANEIAQMQAEYDGIKSDVDANIPVWSAQLIEIQRFYKNVILATGRTAAEGISGNARDSSDGGYTWHDELEEKGFVTLGAYYMTQAKISARIQAAQKHLVKTAGRGVQPFLASQFMNETGTDYDIVRVDERLTAAHNFFRRMAPDDISFHLQTVRNHGIVTKSSEKEGFEKFQEFYHEQAEELLYSLKELLAGEGNGDFLIRINSAGTAIVSLAEILFGLMLVLAIGAKLTGGMAGLALNALASGAGGGFMGTVVGAIMAGLFLVYIFGLILQIVIPFVPLLYWITGIQSWALSIFLAMFFAPLWMMSHARASSDEWVSEHNRSGYLMIVEILLRAPLMVIGLYGATILMKVSSIGLELAVPYLLGLTGEWLGPGSLVIIIVSLTMLAWKLVARTFSLITELNDTLIQRLGSGMQSLGEVGESQQQTNTLIAWSRNTVQTTGSMAGKASSKK